MYLLCSSEILRINLFCSVLFCSGRSYMLAYKCKTTLRLPRYIPIIAFPKYESESTANFTDPLNPNKLDYSLFQLN